jgi:hypothetical protein
LLALQTSREQLERLAPFFERLTPEQTDILRKFLRILPDHAWDFLAHVTSRLTPLTELILAPAFSIFPTVRIEEEKYERKDIAPPDTKALARQFYGEAAMRAAAARNCTEDEAGEAVSSGGEGQAAAAGVEMLCTDATGPSSSVSFSSSSFLLLSLLLLLEWIFGWCRGNNLAAGGDGGGGGLQVYIVIAPGM